MKCLELASLILFLVCIHNVKSQNYSNRCTELDSLKYVKLNIVDPNNGSGVMYKCLRSEIQGAAGKDGKWNMPDDHCPGAALNNFVQISNVALNAPKKRWGEIVSTDRCAEECLKRMNCLSFEMELGMCFFSEYAPSDNYIIRIKKKRFFYKRFYPSEEFIFLKRASIPGRDYLGRTSVQSVAECQIKCRKNPRCLSFEMKLICKGCKRFFCDRTTINFPKYKPYINVNGWDLYLSNPNYKQKCSEPDPMKYVNLNIFNTNRDSMATYKCLHNESVSEKESGKLGNQTDPADYCIDLLFYSCDKIMRCGPVIGNIEMWICPKVLKKKDVLIFCEGISTGNPKEYIRLKKPTNFEVPLISDTKSCPSVGANEIRRYNKVRFLPEEMALDFSDQTFTTFEPLPSAEQMGLSKQNITIDLRGTTFAIDKKARWITSGISADIISTQITNNDQVAVINCSGKCGMCKSLNPFPVIRFVHNQRNKSELWCKSFIPDPRLNGDRYRA